MSKSKVPIEKITGKIGRAAWERMKILRQLNDMYVAAEKNEIRTGNRIRAVEQGADPDPTGEKVKILTPYLKEYTRLKEKLGADIEQRLQQYPIYHLLDRVEGMSFRTITKFLAYVDPWKSVNPSQLHRFSGMGLFDYWQKLITKEEAAVEEDTEEDESQAPDAADGTYKWKYIAPVRGTVFQGFRKDGVTLKTLNLGFTFKVTETTPETRIMVSNTGVAEEVEIGRNLVIIPDAQDMLDKGYVLNRVRDIMVKGFKRPYCKDLKTGIHLFSNQFAKYQVDKLSGKGRTPYARAFVGKKKYYLDRDQDKTPGRSHERAIRWTLKVWETHANVIWRILEGLPVRDPYAIEKLHHTTILKPEDFGWDTVADVAALHKRLKKSAG